MLKLDNNLLEELGLGSLPEDQKRQMLQHIYETLELRVGTQLANQMTDKQLEEFERFIDAGGDANQAQALQWLESNLPNYKQVVQETFDALKVEVKQMAPQLLTAAAQQPAVGAGGAQAPVDPMNAYQMPPQQYQASAPAPQPMQQPVQSQPQSFAQPAQPQQWAQPQPQPQQPQQPQQPHLQPMSAPMPQPSYAQPQPIPQPTQPQQWAQQPQPTASAAQGVSSDAVPSTPQPMQPETQQWQPQPTQPSQPAPDPLTWQPPQPPQTPPPSPSQQQ